RIPMAQYVYTMIRVGKVVPPKRQILKNISLSFHPGAKIGLLGLNGAGKSTVLKIMAGLDKDIEGEATAMPGIRIGYLPQEPQLEVAADALRLPPWDAKVDKLSGGEKRRVALCRLLLSKPDMLLLDEPTNHLDAESVEWLEQYLQRFPGTVVAVTHDRYFLDNAAEWILELDRGTGHPDKGNYTDWLDQNRTRLNKA